MEIKRFCSFVDGRLKKNVRVFDIEDFLGTDAVQGMKRQFLW